MTYLDKQTTKDIKPISEDEKLISKTPVKKDNPKGCFDGALSCIGSCYYAFFCEPSCDETPSEAVRASINTWKMFP